MTIQMESTARERRRREGRSGSEQFKSRVDLVPFADHLNGRNRKWALRKSIGRYIPLVFF